MIRFRKIFVSAVISVLLAACATGVAEKREPDAPPPDSAQPPALPSPPAPVELPPVPRPLALPPPSAPAPDRTVEWELVWADEFDGVTCPDPRNWSYEEGFVRNQELQLYRRENAFCKDGVLIIEARREALENPRYSPGSTNWSTGRKNAEYSSASLHTRGMHAWRYGRIEMRARIDVRAGLWPAFWTLGVSGRWPSNGEIDIMEYYRGEVLAVLHWQRGESVARVPLADFGDPEWAGAFHVWRMDWAADRIQVFIDDRRVANFDILKVRNDDGTNPFRQPHYLKLNLAIGGSSGGDPASTTFPALFEIDYVRVYRVRTAAAQDPVSREQP